MKKRTFTGEKTIQIPAKGEKGNNTVASIRRKHRIGQATYHSRKRKYKDFFIPAAKRSYLQKETLKTTHWMQKM